MKHIPLSIDLNFNNVKKGYIDSKLYRYFSFLIVFMKIFSNKDLCQYVKSMKLIFLLRIFVSFLNMILRSFSVIQLDIRALTNKAN